MRVGDINGKGKIYDSFGMPILGSGEGVLRSVPEDNLNVSEGSSLWDMRTLFPYSGEKGVLYITDRRILFVRTPNMFKVIKGYGYATGTPDAMVDSYRAYVLARKGAFDYCEIPYKEVEGFFVKGGTLGVLFLPSRPNITRKAIMYRKSSKDDKFRVLRGVLSGYLPLTQPEDRKGTYCLGVNRPFLHRKE